MELADIGAQLRRAREAQGLGVSDVQAATNIRSRYLVAIETGDPSVFPGPVYLRGFIRSYASLVGLDGLGLAAALSLPVVDTGAAPPPVRPVRRRRVWPWVLLLLVAAGAVAAWAHQRTRVRVPATTQQQQKPPSQPSAPPALTVTGVGTGAISVVSPTAPLVVKATATADCWVQVTSANQSVFMGMIDTGQTEEWQATAALQLLVGNAGGLSLEVNGQAVGSLGTSGQVVTVAITTH